jgi:hypothetical protein
MKYISFERDIYFIPLFRECFHYHRFPILVLPNNWSFVHNPTISFQSVLRNSHIWYNFVSAFHMVFIEVDDLEISNDFHIWFFVFSV